MVIKSLTVAFQTLEAQASSYNDIITTALEEFINEYNCNLKPQIFIIDKIIFSYAISLVEYFNKSKLTLSGFEILDKDSLNFLENYINKVSNNQ